MNLSRGSAALLLALVGCNFVEQDPAPALQQPAIPEPAPRFGTTVVRPRPVNLARTGASWYLNWTPHPAPGVGIEFVPVVCAYPDVQPVNQARLEELTTHAGNHPDGTLFVIGNEIGHPPQKDRRSPEQYVLDFAACRETLLAANPTFRISVGAVILSEAPPGRDYVGATDGLDYLGSVLSAWERAHGKALPSHYFAATSHVLEGDGTDFETFARQIRRLRRFLFERDLSERGVIITEYGVAIGASDLAARVRFLTEATRFLATARDPQIGCSVDDGRLVQRFAWFNADSIGTFEKLSLLGPAAFLVNISQTALFTRDGQLTALGAAYARVAGASDVP